MLRTGPLRRLLLPLAILLALALPASAFASLSSSLKRQMRAAGPYSGAYVVDTDSGQRLFSWKSSTPRVLASNVKLFTTAAALDRFGIDGTLTTDVVTDGAIDEEGVLRGGLWLRGGGDPAFGTRAYVRKHYGSTAASIELLVRQLKDLGLRSVRGTVRGDESAFDLVRGVRDSGYATSPWVGPLSGLAFNHGYDSNRRFQSNPPSYAAQVFRKVLSSSRIRSGRVASASTAPAEGTVLASVPSPPMARLTRLTNKWSDNYFAEVLLKNIGRDAAGVGSTAAGVRAVRTFAAGEGSRVTLVDGSGLDRGNRAAPREVVDLLRAMRDRDDFLALYDSLPIAGVDGTVYNRMRSGPARRNCRAKTGSLTGVSALSGYCTTRGGREIAFSFLMNGISTSYARRLQDRMAQSIAGWTG